MDITAVYLHINNWCNIVKARYDDTNLSYQCCDEQSSDWFTVLRRHLEHIKKRYNIVSCDSLQQSWSTCEENKRIPG